MTTKQKQGAIVFSFVYILLYSAWLFIIDKQYYLFNLGSNILQAVPAFVASLWLLTKYRRSTDEWKKFWSLLSLGCLNYGIAMVIWMYYEMYLEVKPPFPGIPDFFWMLMIVSFFAALLYITFKTNNMTRVLHLVFDTLIVMAVATTISWNFIINPILHLSQPEDILYRIVYIGYPIGDLGILFGALSLYFIAPTRQKCTVFLLIIGMTVLFISDSIYLYLVTTGNYFTGSPVDLGWAISLFMIGLSVVFYQNDYDAQESTRHKGEKSNKSFQDFISMRLLLPYLSVILLFVIMVFYIEEKNSFLAGSVISILLIIVRQILTLVENHLLLEKSQQLNKVLEEKVKERTQKLEFIAYHDTLTRLPNRRMFEKQLIMKIAQSGNSNEMLSILFIDLDRFKLINDTLGHSTGDLLLQQVSNRLTFAVGKEGMVSRQSGDEFIILINETTRKQTHAIATKILNDLGKPYIIDGHELFISASIGISIFPENGKDLETLIKRADTAMYNVKDSGKNNICFFNENMDQTIMEKMNLENGLRKAIERNELSLEYQPRLDLKTNTIKGMEALLRWNHREIGFVSPATFIPIAEESGLIFSIGEWVLQTACKQNKKWQEQGYSPLTISVNISVKQFSGNDLVKQVSDCLRKTGLEPQYLELEITESIMQNTSEVMSALHKLKNLGVIISIDDFGSGYSSLSVLRNLPIDILKVDRSFIQEIVLNQNDQAIVDTILAIGKNLNLTVVAEGVEYEEQLHYLRLIRCDQVQGYFVSKPLCPLDFEKRIFQGLSKPTSYR